VQWSVDAFRYYNLMQYHYDFIEQKHLFKTIFTKLNILAQFMDCDTYTINCPLSQLSASFVFPRKYLKQHFERSFSSCNS
jgi:hypothetical protein